MEKRDEKVISGSVTLDDALYEFAKLSNENEFLLKRISKIAELIETISKERIRRGLSQRDIAEVTGIKQPMIARFEKIEMMPRIDTFIKIASCLDLDVQLVHTDEYLKFDFIDGINYLNNFKGDEFYGFPEQQEIRYQA